MPSGQFIDIVAVLTVFAIICSGVAKHFVSVRSDLFPVFQYWNYMFQIVLSAWYHHSRMSSDFGRFSCLASRSHLAEGSALDTRARQR